MGLRRPLTAIGAGVTTFLLVAVLVIELLDFEFSAIIGLPVGLLAGLVAFVGFWVSLAELSLGIRRVVSAYATLGLTVLLLLALSYSNIGRDILSTDVMVGIGIAAAVIVYVGLWLTDRDTI